jgi:hypothetical protein
MKEEMMKSLVALIDESLAEIEELKKSDRFSASEIKIEGPGAGIAGKPVNGSLGKDDDGKKDDDDDDDDKKKDMDKAEGKNREADPNGGHHQMDKGEMIAGAADGSSTGSAAGQNRQADPNGGHHKMDKAEDKKDDDKDDKKKDKDDDKKDDLKYEMKKSVEESNTLLKSYVDQRLAPMESKLEQIMTLVKQVADAPAPARGASYKNVAPLKKSDDAEETLTKSVLVDKLLELKKSGSRVDSVDIASAELGGANELAKIATKYNIK